MTTIQPEEEKIRRATKWLVEERKYSPDKSPAKLIEELTLHIEPSQGRVVHWDVAAV